jgi:outer membrane protein TolC
MSNVFARVTQPLTTGGSLSIGFEPPLAYLYLPQGVDPGEFNPIYSTTYVARVIQPVLRGAGSGVALAPIQIAQTQANQTRWALEDVLNSQIRSITEGYWRLYAAHLELESVKTILPLAEESVRVEELRWKADRSILADVSRARFQLDGFRRTQSVMQGNLRKRVLQLRQLLGGQPDVLPLFLPSERPSENPPPEDVPTLVQTAISNRPSLNLIREQLSEKNIVLRVAENQVLPSLNLNGEYYMNGLADRLSDSFRQAGSSNYTDWTLGLGMDVPIGNKTARSRRQIAELDVARVHIRLKALEQNVAFEIAELVSNLQAQWQRLEFAKLQARETQEWLRVSRIRYTQPQGSSTGQDWLLLALTDLQSAMRSYVEAVTIVGEAMAEYNTLLADLNQAQGISVYEWRQQAAQETQGAARGGHAGIFNQDYRANPGPLVEMVHESQKAAEPRLSSGLLAPADGLMLGHSFLNEMEPLPPALPSGASTFDSPRDSFPAQQRLESPVRP